MTGQQTAGDLAGMRVVVTGAGSGVGRATALALAAAGARVGLVARTQGTLEEVAAAIAGVGERASAATPQPRALMLPGDVRDEAQ
ncbi:MAG: SDR family NAD(P)-dependent oxidoreductase, partial [Chloroflexota bacterium]